MNIVHEPLLLRIKVQAEENDRKDGQAIYEDNYISEGSVENVSDA